MGLLKQNWFLEEPLDFELRKYQVKAFRQLTRKHYRKLELYPVKSRVEECAREMEELVRLEKEMASRLMGKITGIDLDKSAIIRNNPLSDQKYLEELTRIIEFSLPLFNELDREGEEIEQFVEHSSTIDRVGIESIYRKEGYLFVASGNSPEIPVFMFSAGLLDQKKIPLISFKYLWTFTKSVFQTFESIKQSIVRQFNELPNPATFVFQSEYEYPVQATLLPVAKKKLIPLILN